MESQCPHSRVTCLNEFETIRKYRCKDCGGIMMCTCDEIRGIKFFSHQLDRGCDLETQARIPVTLGFQPKICEECNGRPPVAHPRASIPGQTSKIARYYWREISFREHELFEEMNPGVEYDVSSSDDLTTLAQKRALEEIKNLHAVNPKFTYSEESQAEVIKKYSVEVLLLKAEHIHLEGERRVFVLDSGDPLSVEEFATRHFQREGYDVLETESAPFHVLFGIYCSQLIADPTDPQNRFQFFGAREDFDNRNPTPQLTAMFKPVDFGTPGYGKRRSAEIEAHIAELPDSTEEWLQLFDLWLEPSAILRNYLWAYEGEDVAKARKIVEILPCDSLKEILRYLLGNYWERFCGWPDLLIWKDRSIQFVEVKSSNDKLSGDQKRWIKDNHEHLGFKFSLVKLARA